VAAGVAKYWTKSKYNWAMKGMDKEQIELGSSPEFWKLIETRRKEKTISRAQLERNLKRADSVRNKVSKRASES